MGVGYLTGQGGGGSNIKSIQRGSFVFGYAETNKKITISNVDLGKTIVRLHYHEIGVSNSNSQKVRVQLLSGTQIEFNLEGTPTDNSTIYWEVIEFDNVKSLQRGSVIVDSPQVDMAINPVDIQKSLMFFSNSTANTITQSRVFDRNVSYSFFTNSFIRWKQNGSYIKKTDWQVIEFN